MSNKLAHRTMAIIGVGAGLALGANTCGALDTDAGPRAEIADYQPSTTHLTDLVLDSVVEVSVSTLPTVESDSLGNESSTTSTEVAVDTIETCVDNSDYSIISSGTLGLLALPVKCSGNGEFVWPSVFPGSPTLEEFIDTENNLSIAIGAHRTKRIEGRTAPFNRLGEVPIGEIITLDESQFVVTETGIVEESDFNNWYNERILQSETKVLGLYTCSDIIGAPKGVNPSLDGTSHRIFVIAQPLDSMEAQAVLSSTTTTMPPVSS